MRITAGPQMGGGPITAFSGSPALGLVYITAAGLVGVSSSVSITAAGNVLIESPTGNRNIAFQVPSGRYGGIFLRTGASTRWAVLKDIAAEIGADAGSPLVISAYTDAGVVIDSPLSIIRAAGGAITFAVARPVTMGALTAASITHGSATLLTTTVSLTNGAGAFVGTLTNCPIAGNPTKYLLVDDNGTTRRIPAW